MNSCQCRFNCTSIAIIASVIIGVVTGFLTLMGTLAVGTPLLWVLFGVAIALLALILATTGAYKTDERQRCLCPALSVVLAGILGTILFALVLLLVDVAIMSVIGAILTGLLFFFFALTLTTIVCLIKCLAGCR